MQESILTHGSQLYRRHCLQCHGLTGDGRGHTAPWINPHPRDFRRGMFKFTSSTEEQGAGRKARREDLLRTLHVGIEGTAMPSFGLLPETELEALASYVIHLSLRGEAEAHAMFDDLEAGMSMEDALKENLQITLRRWVQTEADVIVAAPSPFSGNEGPDNDSYAESVRRGHDFFMANCLACHENYGRKDVYKYDSWGTIVRPMNLTLGIYRGGHRDIDLYWRIYGGINGANMPATVPSALRPEEVWDLVNFVKALPYPAMLPSKKVVEGKVFDVRQKVYGVAE
jgi:mono/diheme cytochrome c family protein